MSEEVEFLRFVGRNARGDRTQTGKTTLIEGTDALPLTPTASVLAVSNAYGLVYAAAPRGFRWAAWREVERAWCEGRPVDACFTDVTLAHMPLTSIDVGSDEVRIVSADGHVKILSVGTHAPRGEWSLAEETSATVQSVRWHPTQPRRCVLVWDGGRADDVKLNDVESDRAMVGRNITCAAWTPSGTLVTGTSGGAVTVGSNTSLAYPASLLGTDDPAVVRAVCCLVNGSYLYVDYAWSDCRTAAVVWRIEEPEGQTFDLGDMCAAGRFDLPDGTPWDPTSHRAVHIAPLDAWRAIVCAANDSESVDVAGSRKAKDLDYAKWVMRDESYQATVPLLDDGGEQFVAGMAVCLNSGEAVELIAGEAPLPPSPVVLVLTDRGGLCAWNMLHVRAPDQGGKYAFMVDPVDVPPGPDAARAGPGLDQPRHGGCADAARAEAAVANQPDNGDRLPRRRDARLQCGGPPPPREACSSVRRCSRMCPNQRCIQR